MAGPEDDEVAKRALQQELLQLGRKGRPSPSDGLTLQEQNEQLMQQILAGAQNAPPAAPAPAVPSALDRLVERTQRHGGVDITRPSGVEAREYDVDEAKNDLFSETVRGLMSQQGYSRARAEQLADNLVREITGRRYVDEDITWREQLVQSFSPALIQEDGRVVPREVQVERGVDAAIQGVLSSGTTMVPRMFRELLPESLRPSTYTGIAFEDPYETFGLAEWTHKKERYPTAETVGMRAENQTSWMLRILGHGILSVLQEGLLSLPLPDIGEAGRAWEEAYMEGGTYEALNEVLPALAGGELGTTLGEILTGADRFQRGQLVDRGSYVGNVLQGMLERIETARGLSADIAAMGIIHGAKHGADLGRQAQLGGLAVLDKVTGGGIIPRMLAQSLPEETETSVEEWARLGYGVGFALDILGGWEDAPITATRALAGVARKAQMLRSVLPDEWSNHLKLVKTALTRPEVEVREYIGRRVGARIEDGSLDPDTLPDWALQAVNEVSLSEYGMTWREAMRSQGLEVADAPAPEVDELGDIQRSADRALRRTLETETEASRRALIDAQAEAQAWNRGEGRPPPPGQEVRREVPPSRMAPGGGEEVVDPGPDELTRRRNRILDERPLPPEDRDLNSVDDFFDLLRRGNYRIPRHYGYERLKHLSPERSVDTPGYALRNTTGDIVMYGSLDAVLSRIVQRAKRGVFDDSIFWRNERPVARWRQVKRTPDQPPLASNYMFASPDEKALIDARRVDLEEAAARKHKKLSPIRAAIAHQVFDGVLGNKGLGRALELRKLGPVGTLFQEGLRVAYARRMPSGKLTMLANGAVVASGDRKRIYDVVRKVMDDAGISERELATEVFSGQRPISIDEAERITKLSRKLGVQLDRIPVPDYVQTRAQLDVPPEGTKARIHKVIRDGQLTPMHVRALRNAALERAGGMLTTRRVAIRGMPRFVDRMQQTAAYLYENGGRMRSALARGASSFLLPFQRSVLHSLPPRARQVLDEVTNDIARVPAEMYEIISRKADEARANMPGATGNRRLDRLNPLLQVNPEELVLELTRDLRLVRLKDVSMAEAHYPWQPGRRPRVYDLDDQQLNYAAQEVFRRLDESLPPHELDVHPVRQWAGSRNRAAQAEGILRWAEETIENAALDGEVYLRQVARVAAKAAPDSAIMDAIREAPLRLKYQVWKTIFEAGDLDPHLMEQVFRQLGHKLDVKSIDSKQAMALWLNDRLAERKLADAMDRLLEEGVVLRMSRGDPRRNALVATLQGNNYMVEELADGTRRRRSRFPESAQTWANQQLGAWGLDPWALSRVAPDLKTLRVRRERFELPSHLQREIERALQRSGKEVQKTLWSQAGVVGETIDSLHRTWKRAAMSIWLVPEMVHYLGQMLGLVPIMWTTLGLRKTATAGITFARHPLMVGEMLRRIGADDHWVFLPDFRGSRTLQTKDGTLYGIDELVLEARKGGLADTQFTIETQRQLADLLADMDTGALDPRRIRAGVSWWNDYLQEIASSFDQTARLSVYLDGIYDGLPPREAAQRARRALLDYRDIPDAEAKFMRAFVSFYAFMRKNADAYTAALFRNPSRVLAQMRLTHELQDETGLINFFQGEHGVGLTPAEVGALRDEDLGRLIIYEQNDVVDDAGRVHPHYKMNRWVTPQIGVAEYLAFWRMFITPEFRPGPDPQAIGDQLLPTWQSVSLLFAGQQAGQGYKPDSFHANRIPPFMMTGPMAGVTQWLFGVGPVRYRPDRDDPGTADTGATALDVEGVPSYWAAGAEKARNGRVLTPEERAIYKKRWQYFKAWLSPLMYQGEAYSRATGNTDPLSNITSWQELITLLAGLRPVGVTREEELVQQHRRDMMFRLREAVRQNTPDNQ